MQTRYTTANPIFGLSTTDLGDIYVPLDFFSEGGVWTIGSSDFGSNSSPMQLFSADVDWKQVSCSILGASFYGIKGDSTLWAWGSNAQGQLGDNTINIKSFPVQTIVGGVNWKQVSAGGYHVAAVRNDGTLWAWGHNAQGQLGNNTITTIISPAQTIVGGTNWKQVACGAYHISAIKTDGTLWTWGYNSNGELGDTTIISKSSPVQTIVGGTNWKQVACGSYHSGAIKTDGTLWLWGYNNVGQLGDTTIVSKSSPAQTIVGGTNWKQVACGEFTTAAIKTDGTLWTWGDNTRGQLGDNTIVAKSSPIQTIQGGTNWKQVACGDSHMVAIKTDCTLWSWGYNNVGQLGDNTIVSKSSPVQIAGGGTNWKQVAAGQQKTIAITFV